jgi:hypothetical protein
MIKNKKKIIHYTYLMILFLKKFKNRFFFRSIDFCLKKKIKIYNNITKKNQI